MEAIRTIVEDYAERQSTPVTSEMIQESRALEHEALHAFSSITERLTIVERYPAESFLWEPFSAGRIQTTKGPVQVAAQLAMIVSPNPDPGTYKAVLKEPYTAMDDSQKPELQTGTTLPVRVFKDANQIHTASMHCGDYRTKDTYTQERMAQVAAFAAVIANLADCVRYLPQRSQT